MDNFAELLSVLKLILGIEDVDDSKDEDFTLYLRMAIAASEAYIDDIIDRRSVTERWTSGLFPQMLRYSNASDLTAVTLDGEDVTAEWKLITQDAFAKLHRADGCSYEILNRELSATYSAGYATCPYDLMLAIASAAADIQEMLSGDAPSPGATVTKEMVTGIGTIEYDRSDAEGMLPARSIQVLNMYRRVGI